MSYTARADRPLSVLHIAGDGSTLCGLPMSTAELWIAVDNRPGDLVCRGCLGLPSRPSKQLSILLDAEGRSDGASAELDVHQG